MCMRLVLAIIITQIVRFITNIFNKDSSAAGKAALAIYPDILSDIEMPNYVIGITGSNGKSSTAEMVCKVLTTAGLKVGCNKGASNIEDIAELVLSNCTLDGKYQNNALVLDIDETKTKEIFSHINLTHYLITNISRNQMSKDGNPEFVLKQIKKSINQKTVLILNADDPSVLSLDSNKMDSHYYGINDSFYATKSNEFIYDDTYYCPRCKSKLVYTYHQFGQVGKYHCSKCRFERKKPEIYISDVDIDNSYIKINDKYGIKLGFNSLSNAYNVLAAYSLCYFMGINGKVIAGCLNDYFDKNGNVKHFKLGLNRGISLISKHENPSSYNHNLNHVLRYEKDCTVLLILDEINKNYFSIDTSWLWDISFELLDSNYIKEVAITGKFVDDLAQRLMYANINMSKVYINKDIAETITHIKEEDRFIYCLASSSDETKVIKEVDAVW